MKRKNTKNEAISILIVSFSLIYIFAFIFTDKMGIIGKIVVQTATRNIGLGAYIFPFLLLFWGFIIFFDYKLPNPYHKFFGISFLFIISLVFIHLKILLLDNSYLLSIDGKGGGLLGYYFSNSLYLYFGIRGAYLVLISLSLISALFITEVSYFYIFNNLSNIIKIILNNISSLFKNTGIRLFKAPRPKEIPDYYEYGIKEKLAENLRKKRKEKKLKEEVIFDEDYQETTISTYQIPPLSLLSDSYAEDKIDTKFNIEENIKILESTFSNFGINAKVVGVIQGPTVTRYEIQPAPGVKISKITNLSNDIALSFAVASVRIEAPIPGKNAVGIEVPNRERIDVYLREILQSDEFKNSKFKLPIALGIDIGGKPIIADLNELPHLLIAGATGSGKSVCINNIILSFIYKLSPETVKFLMIDPKRVELNIYNGIPHLLIPIITDTSQAIKVLNWSISEMEKRFKIFAEAGVRNLDGYNEYVRNMKTDTTALPYIIIIIDELADLMLSSPVKAEEALCRLAQMTRATGIHLIIATQRPSVDIITGSIKINFPSRIAFAVSTQVDSRTILDINGAEKLLGNGDMLFSPVGVSKPIRAQGAFVVEKEIKNVVSYLQKNNPSPIYEQEVLEFKKSKNIYREIEEEEGEDELFNDAVSIIINNKQASISILQRKLRIGYTRAARLIDLMEKKEIVGPYDGRNPRKILISQDEYFNKFEK
ncbi:MAG: DNA translocase FtsK 4TM domain-containing protein [Candidatus Atribacteria bacterium]|nr:DNA translocase FtsK 4TM domain-containing protein [Candidatus Atribacteria bacterium]MCK4308666.1 DNA translocase FtsK 4TM domain-containing protein [Candidatus Atribacteria bacterium]